MLRKEQTKCESCTIDEGGPLGPVYKSKLQTTVSCIHPLVLTSFMAFRHFISGSFASMDFSDDEDSDSVKKIHYWNSSDSFKSSESELEDDDNTNISDPTASCEWSANIEELPTIDFTAKPGLDANNTSLSLHSELNFLNLLFTESMIEKIAEETNLYAKKICEVYPNASSTSAFVPPKMFDDVKISEMYVFLGLVILMSVIRKPSMKLYFSTDALVSTPFFNSAMTRDRFLDIMRYFYFTTSSSTKKLETMNPVLECLR
ncbi:hypothetical protein AVEN_94710-1 [Araneus ventricosus]|uniref:PiggyBac transposable element-derived protein domain-containing protein n=1 Tax=Araneus ventricosus TaxID=182803 RepID=A0A4Y2CLW0_ARAVE|nr:hypothetical protein AVEN_94710-1 [Araneus ventricosus]